MSKFFAYLNRMKHIKRWALMRNTREENIMEHSQQVAVIAHALCVINNKVYGGTADVLKTVLLAQYHEVSEVLTGDLPTPVKYYNPEMRTAYKDLEGKAAEHILERLPEEFKEEYAKYILPEDCEEKRLVKGADRIAAYIKCIEELNAGNPEFARAKKIIEKDIKNMKMKEVDYFMKEFIPAYSMTLDELLG